MVAFRWQAVRVFAAGLVVLAAGLAGCERGGSRPAFKGRAATALVRVSPRTDSMLPSGNQPADMREYEVYKATQAQLIKSRLVLTAALRKPEIVQLSIVKREQDDPVGWLQDNLEVTFPGQSEIMQVSLPERDTDEAAKVVNAVVDAYISEIVDTERNAKAREQATLEEMLATKERDIRNLRTTLKQLADELGTADRETLNLQLQFASQQMGESRQDLRQAQSELRRATVERKVLQAALARVEKKNDAKAPADDAAGSRRDLQRVAEELTALVNQLGQVVVTLSDAQLSQRLQNDLVTIQQQLTTCQGLLDMQLGRFRAAELKDQIEEAELRIASAKEEVAQLEKEVSRQTEEFRRLGQSSVDLEMMRADLDRREAVARELNAKRQKFEIDIRARPRVQVLQQAEAAP